MFESHLETQHRLSYMARGPEWAFAVPAGDLDVLEEVMRLCSGFWNGAGSLILSVARDGRLDRSTDALLDTRPVDRCWLHPSLGDRARAAAQRRLPRCGELTERFDEFEVHPLLLLPDPDPSRSLPLMGVPHFDSTGLRRLALATWGHLFEEDVPHWRGQFEVAPMEGDRALQTLIRGQLSPAVSPLACSQLGMSFLSQNDPHDWPHLYVFSSVTFRGLVSFWNFRARSLRSGTGAGVVGIPRRALAKPELLEPLREWISGPPMTQRTPDLLVSTDRRSAVAVDRALQAIGFREYEGSKLTHTFASNVEARANPLYRHAGLLLGGRFVRGSSGGELIAISGGRASVRLPQPGDLHISNGSVIRVVMKNLPSPLPLTDSAAAMIADNATASDGVMLALHTYGEWNIDFRLLERFDAVEAWARDMGFEAMLTQAGRYAEALLRRLGSLDRLDAFADEPRVSLLRRLAPDSRLKLSQRLLAEARAREVEGIDEQVLAEQLRDVGLFLELGSRTAEELAGLVGASRAEVLAAMTPLIEAGLILRGQNVRCPECGYRSVLGLPEIDEVIACRACRHRFSLSVSTPGGDREPPVSYQLDGLMARVMDQDLLPVLLGVRAMRNRLNAPHFFAWPGMEFRADGRAIDIDVLCSDGRDVYCCEAKDNAASLEDAQLERLLALSRSLEARPVLAGLRNSFRAGQKERLASNGGFVFEAAELLA